MDNVYEVEGVDLNFWWETIVKSATPFISESTTSVRVGTDVRFVYTLTSSKVQHVRSFAITLAQKNTL